MGTVVVLVLSVFLWAGMELQRVAAGGGLGIAVDHADLLSKLVAAANVDRRDFTSHLYLRSDGPHVFKSTVLPTTGNRSAETRAGCVFSAGNA
jgi:hypothetical protein